MFSICFAFSIECRSTVLLENVVKFEQTMKTSGFYICDCDDRTIQHGDSIYLLGMQHVCTSSWMKLVRE